MDIETFADLVREYQAGLRAFIRSLGVHSHAVDDLAQEAFVTAWSRMDRFDPDRDFGKWVSGIARHLVLNERRKTARRSRILSSHLTEILDATTGDDEPIGDAWTQAQLGIMRECLEQVPEKSRAMLIQRYQQGEPTKALAERVGASAEAIRQVLCRVRKAVRDCMEAKQEAVSHAGS